MSAIHRYPGVKPFEATDVALFFGRNQDKADLFDLINREKLVVLFGKSGYGKSSLLKAALIPEMLGKPANRHSIELGEEIQIANKPIYIRFNSFNPGKSMMPCKVVVERFGEAFGNNGGDGAAAAVTQFFYEKKHGDRLWHTFKKNSTAAKHPVFLIFDQFEEFFSYPPEAQMQFRQEISELLYTQIPQAVRDSMGGLDRATKQHIHQPMEIHALFAMRSDRLHLLNGMREELPAILSVRYELKALTEAQATEAIVKPAKLDSPGFLVKKPFGFEQAALDKIIFELKKARESANPDLQIEQNIEAFQLQMVCQTIEQGLISKTKKAGGHQPDLITEADLPDFEQIYHQYYTDKLADLPTQENRDVAHILLEEEMVIGNDMADMSRVSLPKEILIRSMQEEHHLTVDQSIFDYLEDKFLIRRETFGHNVHYEVSHDVLLGPLMKSRDAARKLRADAAEIAAAAKRREAEEAETFAANLAAEEEAAKLRESGKRKKLAKLLTLTTILICALTGLALYVNREKNIATAAVENFKKEEKLRKEAEFREEKAHFINTLSDVEIILESRDGCPDDSQMNQLETMPPKYPDDRSILTRVDKIEETIKTKKCK